MGAVGWLKKRVSDYVDARLGPEFHERTKALTVRQNEYGFDPFGFSRDYLKYGFLFARWMYRSYFRAETHGIDNVPAAGRVLIVANHSGQLPFDGVVLGAALLLDCDPPRMPRSMVEKFIPTVPFASYWFNRWGQITGTPENCRRLLEDEEAIMVFPEGSRGISKPYSKRYQLQRFGLGFMRLALETDTPIVPVGIVGSEEQSPGLMNIRALGRLIGAPAFPITLTFPLLGPAGFLPLPVKFRLHFGAPMRFSGDPSDEDEVVEAKVERVRAAIRELIDEGLRERRTWFA